MIAQARWIAPMQFNAESDGGRLVMDTRSDHAGRGIGPTPMETVLMALLGCTGMDVAGILRKMRAPLDGLIISAVAERATEHPKVLTRIHLVYGAWGRGLTEAQLARAVALSQDKYCSVSAMLRSTAAISYEIVVTEQAPVEDKLAPIAVSA
ncbi:MAG TPA: OsmC family protein [bacterium]|jgi:putative redox protein|nr:OsmC family protein [bacterium]